MGVVGPGGVRLRRGCQSRLRLKLFKGGPGAPLGPLSDRDRGIPHGGFPLGLPGSGGFAPPLSPSSREGWASSLHPALRPLPGTTWGKGGPSRHTRENPHRPTPRFPHNQITHRDPSLTPLPAWLLARGGEEEVFLDSKKKKQQKKEITCYEPVPQERDPPW